MQAFSMALETRPWPAPTLILTGAVACVAGVVAHGVWQQLPTARFGESLMLAALAVLLAWPLRALRGWAWADALACIWLVALVAMTGLVPVLAVGVLVAGSCALGGCVASHARLVATARRELALRSGLTRVERAAPALRRPRRVALSGEAQRRRLLQAAP